MTATWCIQALICILLQLTLFQPVQSCLDYEQTCMQQTDSFDTREHAELVVNCSMNYATLKVNQLNTDFNDLLQVEYVCKNMTTQDETYSCILASNNLKSLDNVLFNISIPYGSFCLIRGCIQDGWSYYYLATNNIRCDGNKNIPITSSVTTGLSSSTDITTNYSTNSHQTILTPISTTSLNGQTKLRSSIISSLVFSTGVSSTVLSSSKTTNVLSTSSTSFPASSTTTTFILSISDRMYHTSFPSPSTNTFPTNSVVVSSTASIDKALNNDVIVTYIDLITEVLSFVVIVTFIAVCVAFCLKRWYKRRQRKKIIANQCLPVESPSQVPVIYMPTHALTTSSSTKTQYCDVIKSDHDWKLSQQNIFSGKNV